VAHTVLVIPVPALDDWVRERTDYYDSSFVSADPAFVHAHITLLTPWLREPDASDLAIVGDIAASIPAFEYDLADLGEFPDGVIHLRPEPTVPFTELSRRLQQAFPQCPPYEGRYPQPVPHLTLDRRNPELTPKTVRASLGDLVPVRELATHVHLQLWANHDCRLLHSWELA
jgi:hypothetical protein